MLEYMMEHWPAEASAGILDSQPMGFYSPRVVLNGARRRGLKVLPPDLHRSGEGFAVEQTGRGLRPFASAVDLYRGTPIERGALENLVRAGFLDNLHPCGEAGRAALLAEIWSLPNKRGKGAQAELPFLIRRAGGNPGRDAEP